MRQLHANSGAVRRLAARALITAAAAPLGQDLGELFALYKPPTRVFETSPLPRGEEPEAVLKPDGENVLKPRGEVHRDGDWHRSIHVWLVDAEGRMVLQRRSEHKDTNPGLLDVSCAGHITGEDAVLSTAVRELEEELGISLDEDDLEAAWLCTLPSKATGETAKLGKYYCNEFQEIFLVEDWAGDVSDFSVGEDEVAGIELIDAGEVIDAWADEDPRFVPRPGHYRRALGAALGFFPSGGW